MTTNYNAFAPPHDVMKQVYTTGLRSEYYRSAERITYNWFVYEFFTHQGLTKSLTSEEHCMSYVMRRI